MSEGVGGTGRFAPSPTGPLHFGSLLAAVASYLDARSHQCRWLLRIENIDPPREPPGAADAIIRVMEHYGFEWDGPVLWQADSHDAHEAALDDLVRNGLAYRCGCSRRDLSGEPTSPLGVIYPGTCRDGTNADEFAWRVRTGTDETGFDDLLQGVQMHRLERESGDFVIKRRDGLIAYQLAVVVDDHLQGVTRVIRGIDLIDSTFRQIWLQKLLGYPSPTYAHIPVAVHANGDKLSKLTGAPGLALNDAAQNLVAALRALGQEPEPELADGSIAEIWDWALEHWSLAPLQGMTSISPDLIRH
jgi:glutamyl-Q tRNA(Asp) synthetase